MPLRGSLLVIAVAGFLAACSTAPPEQRPPAAPIIGARLQPLGGSVARGLITFRPYDGGLTMNADFGIVLSGPYRIAIHSMPNCSSANGFSAGPPIALPGASEPVYSTVRTEGSEGSVSMTVRIPGLTLDGATTGVTGKAVVVHQGTSGSLEASPGVPNNRIACGIIGPTPVIF